MRISRGFTILVFLMLCVTPATAQEDRVTVYVLAPMRDGFIDTSKGIQDSIKDVSSRLGRMREFQLVDTREKADIVLTVITRGVGVEAYGHRMSYREYFNNTILTSEPVLVNTYWVTTVMEVGQYRKELLGSRTREGTSSMGAWGGCAEQITDDLQAWVVANREQLRQRSKIPQP